MSALSAAVGTEVLTGTSQFKVKPAAFCKGMFRKPLSLEIRKSLIQSSWIRQKMSSTNT
jgi:hypothetical protein